MSLQTIIKAGLLTNILVLYVYIADGAIIERELSSNIETSTHAFYDTPTNNNSSIQYHLYTPENPAEICYFEPNPSNDCAFNATYQTKILIHGYTVQLQNGNFFQQMKDMMLEYNTFNIFIVNWTKYDGGAYSTAVAQAYTVGIQVGKMVNYLVTNKSVSPSDVHIIGHSLGAHVAGVAGKHVSNLSRVTGLDPAGPMYSKTVTYNRLTYYSANFVDVIHTSNYETGGYGMIEAIGSIDIYPNGGNQQPNCKIGGQYRDADGELYNITTPVEVGYCNHDTVLLYFLNSIHICKYPCVECANYQFYLQRKCNSGSNQKDRMGLYCAPIPGLPNETTFYIKTSATAPLCETQ